MSMRRRAWLTGTLLAVAGTVHASAQVAEPSALRVDGGDGRVTTWTLEQLRALPPETTRAATRDGGSFEARGVSVTTLLKVAGLHLGANLGGVVVVGRALVARGADCYVAVFGLAEVDPHFWHAPILVVWTTNDGAELPERRGQLALVVAGESRPGRWVRQLVALEVRDLR